MQNSNKATLIFKSKNELNKLLVTNYLSRWVAGYNKFSLSGTLNLFKIKNEHNDMHKLPPAESPPNIILSILFLYVLIIDRYPFIISLNMYSNLY